MIELVDFLVSQIIPKDSYEIVSFEDGNYCTIKIFGNKIDVAKIIGKFGRVIRSIRTIIRAASQHSEKRYEVVIEEK
ncbi:MAG: KH domain-containing protein [Christensenellaceae bacterium]|jgi:predicted RNA-binding protein YlqC (UPF0109 family)|nr:KH domain-containing protein [Christensenellaceae bacterium]